MQCTGLAWAKISREHDRGHARQAHAHGVTAQYGRPAACCQGARLLHVNGLIPKKEARPGLAWAEASREHDRGHARKAHAHGVEAHHGQLVAERQGARLLQLMPPPAALQGFAAHHVAVHAHDCVDGIRVPLHSTHSLSASCGSRIFCRRRAYACLHWHKPSPHAAVPAHRAPQHALFWLD